MRLTSGVVSGVVVVLAACGGASEPPIPQIPSTEPVNPPMIADAATPRELHFPFAGVAYRCGEDVGFVVKTRSDTAFVHMPGSVDTLPQVPAESGTRYSSGAATLWVRGSEALLETGGSTLAGCRSDVESEPWRAARARRVTFRAIGQEPGWHLELTERAGAVFVSDYGQTSWSGRAERPEVDPSRSTIRWLVTAGGANLEVVATDTPCFDVMSGQPYEASVRILFEAREYDGCGRFLR
jgi:putative lipoprotein